VIKVVPLPEYMPDQSVNTGGMLTATNVYPRTDGYGPLRALSAETDALTDDFRGGVSVTSTSGASYLLVGTDAGLVRYNSGAWDDLETGMTVTGHWRFAQFGDYAIGVNGSATKVVDLNAGTSGTLTGAPAGAAIAIVGDYVVIGQDVGDILGIYTSGFNDHTDWNPAGTGGATIQPMLAGGEVMGLAGGEYGVILQRQRIMRMTRTGDATAPFQYDEITPNVGCASKASIVQVGRTVFFLSDRGFMALEDGQSLVPIGSEKVDRTFQAMTARDDYERMFAAVDPRNKLVFWCIPGTPGALWVYNFELRRWSFGQFSIQGIFSGFTSSIGLETVSASYPDLDAMPYSLDDPRFSGGSPQLYGIAGGAMGTFTGDTLDAEFELSFSQFSPGRTTRLRAIRPIGDAVDGQSIEVDCRARLGDTAAISYAGALRNSGVLPIRCTSRYMKPKWSISGGSEWSYAQGMEFEFEAGGAR